MGRVRICGARCHGARKPKCVCWCGGLFHGQRGQRAREVFAEEFGAEPKGEPKNQTEVFLSAMKNAKAVFFAAAPPV